VVATPKELVKAVAEATGVSEATVTVHDRNLLLGGLRTAGKRGRGVAQVTPTDAANLLVAVAGSRSVKDSVKTVKQYSKIESEDERLGNFLPVEELTGLALEHTLLEALVAIFQMISNGSMENVLKEKYGETTDPLKKIGLYVLLSSKPELSADITMTLYDDDAAYGVKQSETVYYNDPANKYYDPDDDNDPDFKFALQYSVSFNLYNIMKIANVLKQ
jgi:hypothetical protein